MKSYLTKSEPSASTGDKITISKQELERMVQGEVQSAMKKKESQLDALINTIQQQLNQGMSSEGSIKLLQTRMLVVAERAEKALAHLNEMPTPPFQSPTTNFQTPTHLSQTETPPLADSPLVQSHLEVKNVRSLSQTSFSLESASVSEFMENTKKEFQRLHAENAALKAAFEDIRDRATPSPTNIRRQSGVMEGLAKLISIKKEPVDPADDMYSPATVPLKRTKEEFQSPEADRNSKRIKSEQELKYPSLPQLPIPMCVPPEAARYSLPSKLKVKLLLFKNTAPKLTVVWELEENDPRAPPMQSYSVFFTSEQQVGSGFFHDWQNLGEYAAAPLPMHTLLSQSSPGHKISVAVVGKDQFGRYGRFSEIACGFM